MSKDNGNINQPDKIPEKQDSSRKITDSNITRLFSQQEIESIIKEFIRAYISGQIKLKLTLPDMNFKNTTYIAAMPSQDVKALSDAVNLRVFIKDLIAKCSGIQPVTPEQFRDSINKLFEVLILFQMNNLLDGRFFDTDVNSRLNSIEQILSKTIGWKDKIDQDIKTILDYIERMDSYRGMK